MLLMQKVEFTHRENMPIQTLIIVPARSGSKGISDKNIKLLGDKPLLAWTARAIEKANPGNCVAVLSTDSERYADVGREAGLHVPFIRPLDCANDTASALVVVDHALQWFTGEYHYLPEQVMWLQPTSPFRSSAIIEQALAMMAQRKADCVIGCKEIHRDLTTLFRTRDGFLTALSEERVQTRRQDVESLLTPNGAMYLCKTSVLQQKRSFYSERTLPLVMDAVMSLDIDTPTDWAMAEALVTAGLVEQ
ncbi:acylneuraminate cytidylyltransferase family protein [Methylobacter sp.]|uniref:acylneuraminate cytidylyltransferase family protein n=1 Tax=Methylobacter sp. TaxID=2051955 RepID=UPI0025D8916D|nr:acylneuraminate cytidylyltransferase family protein [Methylobacter sp.]